MPTQEDLQKKYLQLQFLAAQAQEIQQQVTLLESRIMELKSLIASLETLPNIKKDSETWSALGAGTYVASKLADTKEVLVNIGAGVFMKKAIPKAVETIKAQIENSERYLEQMGQGLQGINRYAEQLQNELAK